LTAVVDGRNTWRGVECRRMIWLESVWNIRCTNRRRRMSVLEKSGASGRLDMWLLSE
jgi:hypothetical protein